ncbi:MAG TPA: GGDEF domain-containing protein, partial [Polyangiaceae bacterium]|nr:GGDEF domain-containing protein [Polyangiaceae bacterium]
LKPRRLHDGDRVGLGRRTVLKVQLQDSLEAEVSERLYESMVRDAVTRAYNRLAFDERLRAEAAFARRHGTALTVIMIDLDHFKRVNDTYGHPAGDRVLREVVRVVDGTIRAEDMLARYGGEELAIIARGITTLQAAAFAERLRSVVESHGIEFGDRRIWVTASFGVATAIDDPNLYDPTALVAAADAALYRAKRDGRNRVALWGAK